uniref:Uncharacterized protein n=1 Tax=Moniliophthora roreri TaxID=221103 RepID=A0A0W0ETQ1_MONRR
MFSATCCIICHPLYLQQPVTILETVGARYRGIVTNLKVPYNERMNEALWALNKQSITQYQKMLEKLHDQGFSLEWTTLAKYIKFAGLGTPRQPERPKDELEQTVLTHLALDPKQTQGPRDFVSQVMQDYYPEGFQQHALGKTKAIRRTALTAIGPHKEWSMDGHDKLAAAGFPIYGIHDKWGGHHIYYQVLPSNHYTIIVRIVFLEAVKKNDYHEPQYFCQRHRKLTVSKECHFKAQLIVVQKYGTLVLFKVLYEHSWRPVFEKWGVNILDFYEKGLYGGTFFLADPIHDQLKNWIWYPLDNIYIRKQKEKKLPSSRKVVDFYEHPDQYSGQLSGVPVNPEVVNYLLVKAYSEGGTDLMHYVDQEFEPVAEEAYALIGSPQITLESAWIIFSRMLQIMGHTGVV